MELRGEVGRSSDDIAQLKARENARQEEHTNNGGEKGSPFLLAPIPFPKHCLQGERSHQKA